MARLAKVKARVMTYDVIRDAVEVGITFGLRRVYKHADASPTDTELERIKEGVQAEVMNALCEALDWDDDVKA